MWKLQLGSFTWDLGSCQIYPLLVLRQYRSRQFIPATQGLAECEFSYRGNNYKGKIREMSNAWKQTHRMKRFTVGAMITPEYHGWRKQIEQIEEEKMNLRLDADVQKLEAERLKKGKVRAEEDLDSLKIDYKKLRLSMRTARFQEIQAQNETLKRSLSENQKEKGELENRVTESEVSLHRHQNRNSVMELRASLNRIEEMKERIEELEAALRNCEIRIEYLEANEDNQNEQLHYFQNQVRDRDHIMGEAMAQIREVADHLQTLVVQADTLSVKYELESSRGKELASLLKKIRIL
ncbi:hypothetical protein Gotur_003047, partial [Gossypium turneri]